MPYVILDLSTGEYLKIHEIFHDRWPNIVTNKTMFYYSLPDAQTSLYNYTEYSKDAHRYYQTHSVLHPNQFEIQWIDDEGT